MEQTQSFQDQDIFLLAPTPDDLEHMWGALLNASPELEGRIAGEFICEEVLKGMATSSFPIKFIFPYPQKEFCIATLIYRLVLNNSNDDIKILLEDSFQTEIPLEKLIIYENSKKLIRIRKLHFFKRESLRILINTIFYTPPVYISYGRDEEATSLLKEIATKFNLLFPHIKIKYDRNDVKYKEDIQSYVEDLTKGENIILLINEKFLKSEYCMKEFIDILNNTTPPSNLGKKIYPVVTESGKCIYNAAKLGEIQSFWKGKRNEVLDGLKTNTSISLKEQLEFIDKVIINLPIFSNTIRKFFTLDLETYRESSFLDLFWEINTQLTKDGFVSFYSHEDEMKEALGLSE
ncbi:MAG: hypothetical protein D3922_05890 [Candidatus Electrothrix sp. AR1]|nr:hypothetical protein [Candidatus Electrothrix sp. AR1]